MFEWILSKPLLFTMNREKGIALGEGVLIYLGFYNESCSDNHRIEAQRNCWNTLAVEVELESDMAE